MRILVFGYGLHGGGFDCANYFLSRGDEVTITDIRSRETLGASIDFLERKGAVIHCGGYLTSDFKWADIVLKSPTIKLDNEFLTYAKRTENDLTFLETIPLAHKINIVCVTGARNKSTSASAICHVLNSLGAKAHSMEPSAFTEIQRWENGDIPEYLIIEMSSWLARDTYHYLKGRVPHIRASLVTSVFDKDDAPESLMRTGEFNLHADHIVCPEEIKSAVEKVAAKKAKNISSIESASKGMAKALPDKMRPAFALLRKLGYSAAQINQALKGFKGIPHRNELVLRTNNAMFINDSSSVMPAAVGFSMDNFENLPVHIICGGSDTGLDPSPMVKFLKTAASIELLEGSFTTDILIPRLKEEGIPFNGPYEKMEEAVSTASSKLDEKSKMLQVVILSPGAAAFESYGNERARGDAFKEAVNRLVRPDSSSN
ncbi:MAG: hypothetical protein J5800_08730 [Spirochaetales bacterium]|nr:hypothetical protein [Spirochaetales bacterium]